MAATAVRSQDRAATATTAVGVAILAGTAAPLAMVVTLRWTAPIQHALAAMVGVQADSAPAATAAPELMVPPAETAAQEACSAEMAAREDPAARQPQPVPAVDAVVMADPRVRRHSAGSAVPEEWAASAVPVTQGCPVDLVATAGAAAMASTAVGPAVVAGSAVSVAPHRSPPMAEAAAKVAAVVRPRTAPVVGAVPVVRAAPAAAD